MDLGPITGNLVIDAMISALFAAFMAGFLSPRGICP